MRQRNFARTIVSQAWVPQGLYTTSPKPPNARRLATEGDRIQTMFEPVPQTEAGFLPTTIHVIVRSLVKGVSGRVLPWVFDFLRFSSRLGY
jgi:hypothetical protein